MKFESGKTYKVRCGWEVYIYDTNAPITEGSRIMGKVVTNEGDRFLDFWNEEGINRYSEDLDLVLTKRTCWVGYKEDEPTVVMHQEPDAEDYVLYVDTWVKMVEVDDDV